MTKIVTAAAALLLPLLAVPAGAFSPVVPSVASSSSSAFACHAPSPASSSSSRSFASLRDGNGDGDEEESIVAFVPPPSFDPLGLSSFSPESDGGSAPSLSAASALAAAALATTTLATNPLPASAAAGPDWGVFEGRTGSLLHPIAMASMLVLSFSTAFLGLKWRRQRTLGDEISSLKRAMPSLGGGASTLAEAIAAVEGEEGGGDAARRVAELKAAIPLEKEIEGLVAERKELSSQGNRDRHYGQGALLAFVGTAFAVEGPLNTYARAGKLFPGPHLYAGAGLVVLWSLAASQVPAMQKGSDAARAIHIGANVAGIGLFVWQVVTGLPILFKVVELTKWP